MARFEIAIDEDDAAYDPEQPWNAAVFEVIDDDGRTGDAIAVGVGATAHAAVEDLLADWNEEGDR